MDRQNYRVSVRRREAGEPVDVIVEAPGAYQALQIAKIEYGEKAVVSQVATLVVGAGVEPTRSPLLTPKWMRGPGGPLAYPIYALSGFIVAKAFGDIDPNTGRGIWVKKLVTVAVCVAILVVLFATLGVLRLLGLIGQG
jgi:hypothetical protein